MTAYKGCPYCDAVFAIGPDDHCPLKQHLRRQHTTQTDGEERLYEEGSEHFTPRLSPDQLAELRRRLVGASDPGEARATFATILYGEGVPVGMIAQWCGIKSSVAQQWVSEADAIRLR